MSELARTIAQAVRSPKVFPSAPLDVDRDGQRGSYIATVAERVYLPPPGSGGLPFTRRMLMLWDPASNREFALATDDSISTIVAPSRDVVEEQSLAQPWLHLGFATQLEEGRADAWVGKSGRLDIVGGTSTGVCSHPLLGTALGFPFMEMPTPAPEECHEMTYHVAASFVLEHRNAEGKRDLFDRLTGRSVTIHIDGQSLPGVRAITHCPESTAETRMLPFRCAPRENFWRAESQFAARFGLDFTRVTKLNQWFFAQRIIDGTGPALACCRQYAAHVRYTVSTPAGDIVRHVDDVEADRDTVLREFWLDSALRDGSRTLMLIPPRYFVRTASQYGMHVLDLTVLPCAPGLRRNDASPPAHNVVDGACYPPADFSKGR